MEDHLTWRRTTSPEQKDTGQLTTRGGGPPVLSRTQARLTILRWRRTTVGVCARGTVEKERTVCKKLPAASGSWGARWGGGSHRGDQTPFLLRERENGLQL